MENTTTPKPDDAQSTTVTMALMCRLTEAELEEESRKLTELLVEKSDLEVAKASSNRHYTDRIKAMEVKIENQIPIVRDREIEREVVCRVDYNTPANGYKRITRLDTNELVEEREMTDAEKQDLFINAGKQETEADAEAAARAPLALPPPEDDGIIDAEVAEDEEVICVDIESDKYNDVVPVIGKLYHINGQLYRAVEPENGTCDGCAFDNDKISSKVCQHIDCEKVQFRHIVPSEPTAIVDADDEHLPKVLLCHCRINPKLVVVGSNIDTFPERVSTFADYAEAVKFVTSCLKEKPEVLGCLRWFDRVENTRSYEEAVAKTEEAAR